MVARTSLVAAACPDCGQLSDRVHAYHQRRLADLPVGGRAVVVHLRVRRLVCAAQSCSRRTFREQAPCGDPAVGAADPGVDRPGR
ncbi:transposase family protein [Mangrovihabitans endophyticus]|uniref:transposase family protein n=1 Tax=Mangrovihabitans endophyticus TaxID=1751298 RepID=UPI001E354254|nr:transposase family protein [Mangrovihabitans endophyticus]